MKVDVYDTYAPSKNGHIIHFDVLVPHGTDAKTAFRFAQDWLASVGEDGHGLSQNRCRFCHSEPAGPDVQQAIAAAGFYILQMEGCPQPVVG